MEDRSPNHLDIFLSAKRDKEAIRSIFMLFILFYFVFAAIAFGVNFFVIRKACPYFEMIVMPLFFAVPLVAVFFRKVRRYTIDYQNSLLIDMGSEQEVIHSQDIMSAELLGREKSFEYVKSSKLVGYVGTYQTKTHGTIQAVATSRDHFVLIKTRAAPQYVISPREPEKFVEFMNGRLGVCG